MAQGNVLARKIARAMGGGTGIGADWGAMDGVDAGFDAALDTGAMPESGALFGADFAPAPPAPDPHLRAWRIGLARAARDQLKLTIASADITKAQVSLTEVLETPMDRALILMVQGRGDEMGLMVMSAQMLAALVEVLTLTRLSPEGPDPADLRKPTRTDAAMAVEFVDAALAEFETILAEGAALSMESDWASGFRYAAFIDDPRPLHLMLEEGEYHLLSADLALEEGTRRGQIWLALPCAAAQAMPSADFSVPEMTFDFPSTPQEDGFADELAAQVMEMPAQLDASLTQIALPLQRLMSLQVGEILALPLANLDQIDVVGLDGRRLARARLGQCRGMRALRLTDMVQNRLAARADAGAGDNAAPLTPHSEGHGALAHPASAQDFPVQIQPELTEAPNDLPALNFAMGM